MANYVKISTLGGWPPLAAPDEDYDAMTERVIDHWRDRLGRVLPDKPDLIAVPECCDRPAGLPRDALDDYYNVRRDRVRDFFAGVARENGCYVACSYMRLLDDGTKRNSTVILDRSGDEAGVYHKNHLVVEECTVQNARYGKDAPVIQCDFGRVGCAICFDLNFDRLRSQYVESRPDLIIFCSAYHGGLMQRYWAYSCRAHFVGAIGNANAPSAVISPVGEILATTTNYFNHVTTTVNLDCEVCHLDYNGGKFRAAKEKYGAKLSITDPGFLGSVLLASESDEVTVDEVIAEFEIEKLNDYFPRVLAHRQAAGNIEP